jgi:hypothetical protein
MATLRIWHAVPAARTPSRLASPRAFWPPAQIVFIEADVPDAQGLLLFGVQPGVEAGLDLAQDGVQQIATHLAGHDNQSLAGIDTGAEGAIPAGIAMLRSAILADYPSSLAQIGVVLATGAAIQSCGCHVGQGAAGVAFLDLLSQVTGGASIAATSHMVGDAAAGSCDPADATSNSDGVPPAIGAIKGITVTASGTINISAGEVATCTVGGCPSHGTGTGANTPDVTPPGPTSVAGAAVSDAPVAFDGCWTIADAISATLTNATIEMVRHRVAARTAISREKITWAAAVLKKPMAEAAACGEIRDPAVDTVSPGPAGRITASGFPGRLPTQNGVQRQPGLDDGPPASGAAHAARVHRRVAFDQRYRKANNKFGNVGQ